MSSPIESEIETENVYEICVQSRVSSCIQQQPSDSQGKFDFKLLGNESVKRLKQLIKEQHTLHPEEKRQNLIFRGKVLKDSQTITEIFSNSELRSVFLVLKESKSLDISNENEPNNCIESTPPLGNIPIQQNVVNKFIGNQAFPLIGFLKDNGEVIFINEAGAQYREMLRFPIAKCRLLNSNVPQQAPAAVPEQRPTETIMQILIELKSKIPVNFILLTIKMGIFFFLISRKLNLARKILLGIIMLFAMLYHLKVLKIPTLDSVQNALSTRNNQTQRITGKVTDIFKEIANLFIPFFMSIFPNAVQNHA